MSMHQLNQHSPKTIVQKVNSNGLSSAARHFGVSASTLSRWLKAQHYQIKRIYVKEEQQAS
jgi:transposase-like protein